MGSVASSVGVSVAGSMAVSVVGFGVVLAFSMLGSAARPIMLFTVVARSLLGVLYCVGLLLGSGATWLDSTWSSATWLGV